MLHLPVKTRDKNKKAKHFLQEDVLPAVMYGPKNPPKSLSVGYKSFYNIYREAGETTLIALDIDKGDSKENKEGEEVTQEVLSQANNVVLIREVQVHPVSGKSMCINFPLTGCTCTSLIKTTLFACDRTSCVTSSPSLFSLLSPLSISKAIRVVSPASL